MKNIFICIVLLSGNITHCGSSIKLQIVSSTLQCLYKDLVNIIDEYDARDSCLESHSKKYSAYVQNADCWNGKVAIYNQENIEIQSFCAYYIKAIALSPEDLLIVMHKELTSYFRWKLSITGFSIESGTSDTYVPSWYTSTFSNIEQPVSTQELPIKASCTISLSRWPDMSNAHIKRMSFDDEGFIVETYNPIPYPSWHDHKSPLQFKESTCTLIDTAPWFLQKMKRELTTKKTNILTTIAWYASHARFAIVNLLTK